MYLKTKSDTIFNSDLASCVKMNNSQQAVMRVEMTPLLFRSSSILSFFWAGRYETTYSWTTSSTQ